jgi:hypothetical protein
VDYRNAAYQAAVRAGHPAPELFVRQIGAESGFRPNAVSPAGARGIAQIMPATARGWGVNPDDPLAALDAAARAMAKYIKSYKGDHAKALAAYNAGVGAVQKHGGVPPYKETQNYIKKILGGKTPPATAAAPAAPVASSGGGDPFLDEYLKGTAWEGFDKRMGYASPSRPSASVGPDVQTGAGVPARRPGELGWQYLQRVASTKFGLRNDPGNSQTTGGRHAAGSPHYDGRAIDFGDARNTKAQLDAWAKYARENFDALGLERVIWQQPGHFNHVDVATKRSAKGVKKR